jgi:hypothetical protein
MEPPGDGRDRRDCLRPGPPFRMPVQWVNRPNLDFRGFAGTIAGGIVRPGDRCACCPRGARARWRASSPSTAISTQAVAGQSVTLTLADEIDISRGDVIARLDRAPAEVADQFECHLVWMDDEPMLPGRPYLLKIGADGHGARSPRSSTVNVNTLEHVAAKTLELNEIGVCNLSLDRQADRLRALPTTATLGGFILIDRSPTHRRRGHDALRAAPRAQHPLAAAGRRQAARAARQGPPGSGRAVVHRALRRRQVDDRQPGREEAARARPAHLPARRRQRAPRPQQGSRLHRRRPRREHPPRRRGREADGRRRPDRAGLLHLALPRRARMARGSGPRASSSRSSSTRRSRWPRRATSRASTPRRGAAS